MKKDPESACLSHCVNCMQRWCCSLEAGDCPCLECPNMCGARLHSCKLEDHVELICPMTLTACLSREYGCPVVLPRHSLAKHIKYCPASIVHCTIEWNRWPRCSGEKHPCLLPTSLCHKRLLSNNNIKMVNGDHEGSPGPRGDQFCISEFDLALAVRDQSALEAGMRVPKHTRRALRNSLTQRFPAFPMTSDTCHRCGSEPPCSACNSTASGSSMPPDDVDTVLGPPGLSSTVCDRLFRPTNGPSPTRPTTCLFMGSDREKNHSELMIGVAEGGEKSPADTPLVEAMAWAVNDRTLQVDCLMEFFPRYQHKPRAMYTFLCAQDVRREEFPCHYRLHSDIYCQVDGWVEQRCPLAYLGCPFIVQRMQPNRVDCTLVYSPHHSSFSLRYWDPGASVSRETQGRARGLPSLKLTDLPNEVLIRIARFVDNFTLHSLSRTCRRMEEVCCYLLPTRGSVTLLWKRVRKEPTGLVTWSSSERAWFFTTGTDRMDRWCFTPASSSALHEHLKDCPFYERNTPDRPFSFHLTEGWPFDKMLTN